MPLGEACYIMREVAQALHHAYWSTDMTGQRLSVVHRDVSPHNIILSYDGAVKLLDFGVAISAVTEHEEMMIVGKWRYMSPETTANQHIDHRSDLFSLGVVLYLLCSGQMPFAGRDVKEIVRKIRIGEYRPLQEIVAVPERLAVLVGRLLSPDPDDRPQYGQDVAAELTEIARQYGMESSGPRIAHVLGQLFPSEAGGAADQPAPVVHEIVMDGRSQGSPSPTYASGPVATGSSPAVARNPEYSGSIQVNTGSAPGARFPSAIPTTNASVPISRQFPAAMPTTNHSSPVPTAARHSASAITRQKTPSSQLPRQLVSPVHAAVPTRPSTGSSISVVRVLITVAIGVLLALGMLLLLRPS